MLLAGDYRIGAIGNYKIGTNEIKVGLIVPHSGIELCRQRLLASELPLRVPPAEECTPDQPVYTGSLDLAV